MDHTFQCNDIKSNQKCIKYGKEVIQSLSFQQYTLWECIGYLCILLICFHLIAFIILKFNKIKYLDVTINNDDGEIETHSNSCIDIQCENVCDDHSD